MYQVTEQYRALMILMQSMDGEEGAQEAIQEAFNEVMQDQANGAEVAAKIIRETEALCVGLKFEIDRLSDLMKARKSKIERAKEAVRLSLIESEKASGVHSIETTIGTFSLRKGSEKTVVHDEEALIQLSVESELAQDCVKVEVIKKPVLAEVKRLIKENLIPASIASIVLGDKTISFK